MLIPRIKEAILRYNLNVRKPGESEITQKSTAEYVILGERKNKHWLISRWSKGESLTALNPEHIVRMCEYFKCDANYLLNIEPIKP